MYSSIAVDSTNYAKAQMKLANILFLYGIDLLPEDSITSLVDLSLVTENQDIHTLANKAFIKLIEDMVGLEENKIDFSCRAMFLISAQKYLVKTRNVLVAEYEKYESSPAKFTVIETKNEELNNVPCETMEEFNNILKSTLDFNSKVRQEIYAIKKLRCEAELKVKQTKQDRIADLTKENLILIEQMRGLTSKNNKLEDENQKLKQQLAALMSAGQPLMTMLFNMQHDSVVPKAAQNHADETSTKRVSISKKV